MTYKQDLKDNEESIKELTKEMGRLNIKFEIMNERVNTIQRLVYGLVGIALTAVAYAILGNIGL